VTGETTVGLAAVTDDVVAVVTLLAGPADAVAASGCRLDIGIAGPGIPFQANRRRAAGRGEQET
jgi:hypothetical protein